MVHNQHRNINDLLQAFLNLGLFKRDEDLVENGGPSAPPAAAAASPAGNINFNFSAMPSAEVGDGAQSESGDGAATVAMVDFQAMVGQLVSQGMDMTTAAATALQQIAALQQQRQNQ